MVYHGEFAEYFIRSFCETVYKYQGADIDENYNIYDVHRMHKKTIKKFEYIHMNFKEVKNRYFIRVQPRLELLKSKFSSMFKNTNIYIIMFDDGRVYLGLTFVELKMRLKWHLSNKKSQVYND